MAVVSFTRPFTTLIFTLSPMLTLKGGHGHCPLIPTKGRANPSGAALTHPMFQLKVFKLPAGAVFAGQGDRDTVELEDDAVEVEEVLLEEDFVVKVVELEVLLEEDEVAKVVEVEEAPLEEDDLEGLVEVEDAPGEDFVVMEELEWNAPAGVTDRILLLVDMDAD